MWSSVYIPSAAAMIVKHLFAHWRAMRTEYTLLRWYLCVARSLRVLFFWRGHRKLFSLPVYHDYVLGEQNHDAFYHLSHRYYLLQGLSASQRLAIWGSSALALTV